MFYEVRTIIPKCGIFAAYPYGSASITVAAPSGTDYNSQPYRQTQYVCL